MIADLLLLFFCVVAVHASHLPRRIDIDDISCPFSHPHGKPCLRDQVKALDYDVIQNTRPDIDYKSASHSELESNRQCCYEEHCLERCRALHLTLSDFVEKHIGSPKALVENHEVFFKNVEQSDLDRLTDGTASARTKTMWRIRLAHFEHLKMELEAAEDELSRLNQLLA